MRLPRLTLALTASLGLLGGCSLMGGERPTPAEVYAEAADTFVDVVATLEALREAGKIDDDTWAIILPLIEEGRQFMDQWAAQLDAGDVDAARLTRSAVRGITTRLIVYLSARD